MKTIISILFISLATQTYSIGLSGNTKVGIVNTINDSYDYHFTRQLYSNTYIKGITKFNRFELSVFNSIETWTTIKSTAKYNPFRINYTIGFIVGFSNVGIGIEHQCSHPIYNTYTHMTEKNIWVGEYNLLFITLSY